MTKIKVYLKKYQYGLTMAIIGIIVAIFDLGSKLITDGKNWSVIKGFLNVTSSHNKGVGYSLFSSSPAWVIILITSIFILGLIIFNWFFKSKNFCYCLGMGLILSGAICNLFDRIVFGYVRDFIEVKFIEFPIFNIADCAITLGVVFLCVFCLFMYKSTSNKNMDNTIEIKDK